MPPIVEREPMRMCPRCGHTANESVWELEQRKVEALEQIATHVSHLRAYGFRDPDNYPKYVTPKPKD